jgi:hypothetical protein
MKTTVVSTGIVALISVALAQSPEPGVAQLPTRNILRVALQDGSRLLLREWMFSYSWGEADRPPEKPGVFFYSPVNKRTRDLLMRRPKGRSTYGEVDAVIPGGMLSAITFSWDEAIPHRVKVELVNREVIVLEYGSFEVAEGLLSRKPHVHSVSLNLEGKRVGGNDLLLSWPLNGRGPVWDPKGADTVVSIDFRPR